MEFIKRHEELIEGNILPRLQAVEEAQEDFRDQVTKIINDVSLLSRGQQSLELTVIKDGQATRELLNKFVDHFFKRDTNELKASEKVTIKKLDTREKIMIAFFTGICGTGGLAGIIAAFQIFTK